MGERTKGKILARLVDLPLNQVLLNSLHSIPLHLSCRCLCLFETGSSAFGYHLGRKTKEIMFNKRRALQIVRIEWS
jgi:hypothetical protein